jgi:predicted metalloprotease with PDZ domain
MGITTRESGNNLTITGVEWNSPGYNAGLSPQDIITEIDGEKATSVLLNRILGEKKAGDKISLTVTHRDITNKVEVPLSLKQRRSFEIRPMAQPSAEQAALLKSWLK